MVSYIMLQNLFFQINADFIIFHQRVLKKYSTVLNIIINNNNNKCFLNSKSAYSIRMISEGSCDTEDKDHRNKLHFKIY